MLREVKLRNFLWEKYDYVKEESYAPLLPTLLKIDIVLDNERLHVPLPLLELYQRISPSPRTCEFYRNMVIFTVKSY